MANNYFQFKQFKVEQDRCAMKVTTDACIQGAWTPVLPGVKRVLDIGAGTGLLSLMLAQRNADIAVDAIEFDKDACAQARDNATASPWTDLVNIIEGDVRTYDFSHKYDLIISNPPFFNNSLLGDTAAKNNARHTLSLSYTDLLNVMAGSLNDDGYVSILLPATEYGQWSDLMQENGWGEFERLSISHRPGAAVKRIVGLFHKKDVAGASKALLTIQGDDNNYTPAFIDLLAPFYLNF